MVNCRRLIFENLTSNWAALICLPLTEFRRQFLVLHTNSVNTIQCENMRLVGQAVDKKKKKTIQISLLAIMVEIEIVLLFFVRKEMQIFKRNVFKTNNSLIYSGSQLCIQFLLVRGCPGFCMVTFLWVERRWILKRRLTRSIWLCRTKWQSEWNVSPSEKYNVIKAFVLKC